MLTQLRASIPAPAMLPLGSPASPEAKARRQVREVGSSLTVCFHPKLNSTSTSSLHIM